MKKTGFDTNWIETKRLCWGLQQEQKRMVDLTLWNIFSIDGECCDL